MATDTKSKQAQRLWPRWLIAGSSPVKVDMGPAGSGHLVDISGGGLRVQSLVPLKVGAEIPVRIEVPEREERLQCSGIVVWSRGNGAAGIRFTTLIESQQLILRDWLDRLQKIATSPQEFQQRDEFTNILSHIRGAQLNQADALKVIAVRVTELTPASGAAVALGTPENMICLAASGVAPEIGTAVQQGTGLTGECILRRKMVHCQNAKNDPRVDKSFSFGSAVILPLLVSGEMRGVLEAFALQPNAFDAGAIETLEKLADAVIFTSYGVVPQRRLTPKHPGGGTAKDAAAATKSTFSPHVPTSVTETTSVSQLQSLADTPVGVTSSASSKTFNPQSEKTANFAIMSSAPAARATSMQGSLASENDVDLLGIENIDIEGIEPVAEIADAPSIPFIQIPPELKEAPVRRSSNPGMWMPIAFCVLAIASVLGWKFVWIPMHAARSATTQQSVQATEASDALQVTAPAAATQKPEAPFTSASTAPSNPATSATPSTSQEGGLAGAVTATAKVPLTSSPKTEKQEKKTEQPNAPEEKPLLLAPSTGKVPRPVEEDAVAAPITISTETSVPQIALPATSSMPKLTAETPRVRTGGALIKRIEPVYPTMARSAGLQGAVELEFRIMKDGSVGDVHRLSGQSVLANAAIEAVKRWRYDPVKINGEPIEVESKVKLNFTLAR